MSQAADTQVGRLNNVTFLVHTPNINMDNARRPTTSLSITLESDKAAVKLTVTVNFCSLRGRVLIIKFNWFRGTSRLKVEVHLEAYIKMLCKLFFNFLNLNLILIAEQFHCFQSKRYLLSMTCPLT